MFIVHIESLYFIATETKLLHIKAQSVPYNKDLSPQASMNLMVVFFNTSPIFINIRSLDIRSNRLYEQFV